MATSKALPLAALLCLALLHDACAIIPIYVRPGDEAVIPTRKPTTDDRTLVRAAINTFLQEQSFNRDQVLAYSSTAPRSVPAEDKHDGSNYIVIKRQRKSISQGQGDIGVVAANEHRTYPGSLLLANSRLTDNQPDQVILGRQPLTYTLNLPGLSRQDGSFNVTPSFADYTGALNKALKSWFDDYPEDHHITAQVKSEFSLVSSKEQLRVKLGAEIKYSGLESDIDFESVSNSEKSVLVSKFKQVFYTVSVPSPRNPADLFDDTVSLEEASRKMPASEPPVLVDSVSYGRVVYVLAETSSTSSEAKAKLQASFGNYGKINSETEFAKSLENLSVRVYLMGGGMKHIELIDAKTPEDITRVIKESAEFGRDNPGYPLSYSTQFLKDNSRALVQGSAEYTETTREVFNAGELMLEHKGAYVAQMQVSWKVRSYDRYGNEQFQMVYWSNNWDSLSSYWSTHIQLPGNTVSVSVFSRGCTGLFWEWWRKTYARYDMPMLPWRKVTVFGTSLNQLYEEST